MPVVLSQISGVQLLGVPKIGSADAISMADGVFEIVNEWNLQDKIVGICFDLTNPNSGEFGGAALYLERLFGRPLFKCACRHHLLEIMLRGAFEAHFGGTHAPLPSFFARFQKEWSTIDQTKYEAGIKNDFVRTALEDVSEDIIEFCEKELENHFVRDDYKELLELTLIFLGVKPPSGKVHFRPPGAMHHARWMSKALYALKIFMFLKFFQLSKVDIDALTYFCSFVVRFYVKAWTRCTRAVEAPQNDLNFMKGIHAYAAIDPVTSKVIFKKFGTHLWYLAEETIALAFFDDNVSIEEKRVMRDTLRAQPPKNDETRVFRLTIRPTQMSNLQEWKLHQFITENTITFFDRFKFSMNFMDKDPSEWKDDEEYKEILQSLADLQVVNDHAERAV